MAQRLKKALRSGPLKVPGSSTANVVSALVHWFKKNKRTLPWRTTGTPDPYRVWVSEVMLQQTQVNTVIPYFERFMNRFPDLASLAKAPPSDVLELWSGLGYYSRARLLHRGVQEAYSQYGNVPKDRALRSQLPSIGPYTLGAIGSIAFGLREPIVDGNVTRVLSRYHHLGDPIGSKSLTDSLWQQASEWVNANEKSSPSDINQGLMELGATVCTKHQPQCPRCPLNATCLAYKNDSVDALPTPKKSKRPIAQRWVTLVVQHKNKVLFAEHVGRLYQGLIGFPFVLPPDPAEKNWMNLIGLSANHHSKVTRIGKFTHVLTHRRFAVEVFHLELKKPAKNVVSDSSEAWTNPRWLTLAKARSLGTSTLTQRILDVMNQEHLLRAVTALDPVD